MTATVPPFTWRTAIGYLLGFLFAVVGAGSWAVVFYVGFDLATSAFSSPSYTPHGGGENNLGTGLAVLFYAGFILLGVIASCVGSIIGAAVTLDTPLRRLFRFAAVANGSMAAALLILAFALLTFR